MPKSEEEMEREAEMYLQAMFIGQAYKLATGKSLVTGEDASKLEAMWDTASTVLMLFGLKGIGAAGEAKVAGSEAGEARVAGSKWKLKIIDGKVGGKIPVDDYNAIRNSSVKNPSSKSLTLGKYADDATSYTKREGNTSYFDMGDDFNATRQKYNLSGGEMFEYFNKPVLDDAISSGKTIRFSHNPVKDIKFLGMEWNYIKSVTGLNDSSLFFEGGFWYVRP